MDAARSICLLMVLCLIFCFISKGTTLPSEFCDDYEGNGDCPSIDKCKEKCESPITPESWGFCTHNEEGEYGCYCCYDKTPKQQEEEYGTANEENGEGYQTANEGDEDGLYTSEP